MEIAASTSMIKILVSGRHFLVQNVLTRARTSISNILSTKSSHAIPTQSLNHQMSATLDVHHPLWYSPSIYSFTSSFDHLRLLWRSPSICYFTSSFDRDMDLNSLVDRLAREGESSPLLRQCESLLRESSRRSLRTLCQR
jgi:hypothetical protein